MGKLVLIVDDSATMVLSVRTMLEFYGFLVESANDGVQALARLTKGSRPDLIITDVNMPNMDGLELIRRVRMLPSLRFTPILTLTTEGQAQKRDEGRRLGATGWLVKPILGPDLVKVIKQVLPGA
jgi:two-component system chemotaxis response regulator CheY